MIAMFVEQENGLALAQPERSVQTPRETTAWLGTAPSRSDFRVCSTVSAVRVSAQDTATETIRKVKSKVLPGYPKITSQLKLQGKVRIGVTISADGFVTNTKVIGGHPVLANAAVAAVIQWLFASGPKNTTEVVEMNFAGRD
jgi:TonB family protein